MFFFQKVIKLFKHISPTCRIIEVDTINKTVIFQLERKATFLRCSLSDAVSDLSVIKRLSSYEACWLGGYYGRAFRVSLMKGKMLKEKAKNMRFLLSSKKGRYKIIFENRDGQVGYIDKKTRREFIEHPLIIANNEHVIEEFDPTQACYIGILAGISMEKMLSKGERGDKAELSKLLKKPAKLRIVQ